MIDRTLLIVGDGSSIFVRDFARQYIDRGGHVDLISTSQHKPIAGIRRDKEIVFSKKIGLSSVDYIVFLHCFWRILWNTESKYDAVVIQSVNFLLFLPAFLLKKRTRKLVTVVWGSDYYRSTQLMKSLQRFIYRASDAIVFTNPATLADFESSETRLKNKRKSVARFGLPVLDYITELDGCSSSELEGFRKKFGICTGKLVVMLGYSGSPAHRHIEVLQVLSGLEREIKRKIHLVFPLGYGNREIASKLRARGDLLTDFSYSILEEFYDYETVAKLRKVTDILINVQSTDQYSGSMQETLFAGGGVIAGDWLPYGDLIKNGARILSVGSLQEISSRISSLARSFETDAIPTSKIRKHIAETSTWKSNLQHWDRLLFGEAR